ncbi:uncharacterized protein E5676_scaffold451G001530 [Cucumis melo var. makuwa]|uniref:Transposase n=1 Tax=Cucumis melo var. makuwa TaxID=1194695 RepID=A0A5D3BPE5_CUCMM|nr:uncharacterized protein E5676_scaffold451G001530 [Cucumis melo var. makuwa]
MQKERYKNYKYNHKTSRKGYANLGEELKKEGKLPPSIDRATLWKHARVGKDEEFMNKEVEEIVRKIDKLRKDVDKTNSVSNDILTQALGTPEHRGCVRGVGELITPSFYFHKHIPLESRETQISVDVDAN